jgi:hypothetical protein
MLTNSKPIRYAAWFAVGIIVFIGMPEAARWMNGGAFAQGPPSAVMPLPGPTNVGGTSSGQVGGETGTINNNGPVYNAPTSNTPLAGGRIIINKLITRGIGRDCIVNNGGSIQIGEADLECNRDAIRNRK